jgi:hypothetical protein
MVNNDPIYKKIFIDNEEPINNVARDIVTLLKFYVEQFKSSHKNYKKLLEIVEKHFDKIHLTSIYNLLNIQSVKNASIISLTDRISNLITTTDMSYKHKICSKVFLFNKYLADKSIIKYIFKDFVNTHIINKISINALETLELLQILCYIKDKDIEIFDIIKEESKNVVNTLLKELKGDELHIIIKKCNLLYIAEVMEIVLEDKNTLTNELNYFIPENLEDYRNLSYFQKMIINNLLYVYKPSYKGFHLNTNEKEIFSYDTVKLCLVNILKDIDSEFEIQNDVVFKKNYADVFISNRNIAFVIVLNTNIFGVNGLNQCIVNDMYLNIQRTYVQENFKVKLIGISDEMILLNPDIVAGELKKII